MSVHPSPKNLAKEFVRRVVPKRQQPSKHKLPSGEFPQVVKDRMFARAHGVCELDGCGPVEVYHHRAPRGAGGTSLPWIGKAANGLGVSHSCHDLIENARHRSYVNGWLIRRNGLKKAEQVHVRYRGAYVLLGDDGSISPIEGATP
jgi:hypothetical protein